MLNWSDKYLVDINEIDNQHKTLFKLYNKLELLYNSKPDDLDSVHDMLNRLTNYAKRHFESEEIFFQKTNYPSQVKHTRIHNRFKQKISEFKENESSEQTFAELLDFLGNWIKNHILIEDMQYSTFVKKKKKRKNNE